MENHQNNRPSLFAASGFFLLAAFGLWAAWLFGDDLLALVQGAWPGATTETLSLIFSLVYYLPFVLLPAVLWIRNSGDASALRPAPVTLGAMIRISIIAVVAVLVVQDFSVFWYLIWQKLGLNVFADSYIRPANTSELMLSTIAAAIITPISEELLFRGVILSAWERRGTKQAVLVSAVLFAVLHGSLLGLPGLLFGGLLLGALVVWTNSIYAGLIFHSVYNAAGVLMNYNAASIATEAAEEALMETDLLAYVGGWTTLGMLALEIVLMLALILLLTRRFRLIYALRRIMEKDGKITPEKLGESRMAFQSRRMFGETVPADRSPLPSAVMLVLLLGVLSSVGLFMKDIFSMLGG